MHQEAGLTTYVYPGRVLLPVRLMVASGVGSGPLSLTARVTWLECDKECVPGKATATRSLRIGVARVASLEAPAIESAVASLPRPDPPIVLRAAWAGPGEGGERFLNLSIPAAAAAGFQAFLPYEQSGFDLAAEAGSNASRPGMAAVWIRVTDR